nr:MAG TPA: hypothetical protein [Caudoviricetes sp.]
MNNNQQIKSYILLFVVILNILLIGYGFNYRPIVGMVVFISTVTLWTYFPYDKFFNEWWKKKE